MQHPLSCFARLILVVAWFLALSYLLAFSFEVCYTAFARTHHLLDPLHGKLCMLKNSCCPLKQVHTLPVERV